jgi:hypothetical protein
MIYKQSQLAPISFPPIGVTFYRNILGLEEIYKAPLRGQCACPLSMLRRIPSKEHANTYPIATKRMQSCCKHKLLVPGTSRVPHTVQVGLHYCDVGQDSLLVC